MTARSLPREFGVVLECNGEGCTARYQTANVYKKINRAAAKRDGWIRGGRKGTRTQVSTKRHDFCPTCAPIELAAIAKQRADAEARKVARDEARKARMAGTAKKRARAVGREADEAAMREDTEPTARKVRPEQEWERG